MSDGPSKKQKGGEAPMDTDQLMVDGFSVEKITEPTPQQVTGRMQVDLQGRKKLSVKGNRATPDLTTKARAYICLMHLHEQFKRVLSIPNNQDIFLISEITSVSGKH